MAGAGTRNGLIRAWHEGREVVNATGLATCRAGARPYFKFGIYRGGSNQGNQVVWHDEYRRGARRAAVDPAVARGTASPARAR